jgi:hypothetical protein
MLSKLKEHVKRQNPMNENELFHHIEVGSNLVTNVDAEGYFRKMLSYLIRCLNNEPIYD